MRRAPFVLITAVVILLFNAACATGPSSSDREREVPSWVTTSPEDGSEEVYFIGAGSDSKGNVSQARGKAVESLISSIVSFIGVEVKTDTPPEAKKALDEFTSDLERSALTEEKALLPGFSIEETHIEERGSLVNVYLLAVYGRDELLEQKSRLRELFEHKSSTTENLEKQGDGLYGEGALYRAAEKYIEAAATAVEEKIPSSGEAYRRNIAKAEEALSKISFERINNYLVGYIRQSFSTPFECRVFVEEREEAGLGGVPLRVRYRVASETGAMTMESSSVLTNEAGIAQFTRPAPLFVGSETLSFELDVQDILAPLRKIEDERDGIRSEVRELQNTASEKRLSFSYTVASRGKEVLSAVWAVGFDNGGNALPQTDISAGILEVLNNQDFNVNSISLETTLLKKDIDAIVEELGNAFGNRYERLIFGSAYISDFKDEGERYTVTVSGSVKAVDIPSGITLYNSDTVSKSANGQNPQSAMSTAFKEFGKHVGKNLAKQLP